MDELSLIKCVETSGRASQHEVLWCLKCEPFARMQV